MNDRPLADFLTPGFAVQAIGEQLLFHQPTVKFILQFGHPERAQFRRQQTQNVIALLEPVDLLGHGSRFAHQGAEGFHWRIFLWDRLCLPGAAQLFCKLHQLGLLRQKIAVPDDQLIVPAPQLAGAHIPESSGSVLIFHQHLLQLAA